MYATGHDRRAVMALRATHSNCMHKYYGSKKGGKGCYFFEGDFRRSFGLREKNENPISCSSQDLNWTICNSYCMRCISDWWSASKTRATNWRTPDRRILVWSTSDATAGQAAARGCVRNSVGLWW